MLTYHTHKIHSFMVVSMLKLNEKCAKNDEFIKKDKQNFMNVIKRLNENN